MWQTLNRWSRIDPDFTSNITALLDTTSQKLIIGITLAYTAVQLIFVVAMRSVEGVDFFLYSTPFLLGAGYFSLKVLKRNIRLAYIIWQTGFAVIITLIVYVFQKPSFGFFYAFLPFVATVMVGWSAGILWNGGIGLFVLWDAYGPWSSNLLSPYGWEIILGGSFAGAIGWFLIDMLLTVVFWALSSYKQSHQVVQEIRNRRLEYEQVQEDLLLANRELVTLSDRLKEMRHVADEARQAKEEFVANVSHELRTPLNMIIGFSEMITQAPHVYGVELPAALLADITTIQRNSDHLAKLVNDVLDLSQVEAGRMALSKEWVPLQDIIAEAVAAVHPLFDTKGLYLQTDMPQTLPPVFCDEIRIRQIVLNLLSNASRFTEHGGVRIATTHTESEVVVSVSDTGPGISPDAQARIFEPFYQVDGSIRRRHGGSGLGLSICKRFVEMHGGKIWLETQKDTGTSFFFSFPLAQPAPVSVERNIVSTINPDFEYRQRTRPFKAPKPKASRRLVLLENGQVLAQWFARYWDEIEIVKFSDVDQAVAELNRLPAQAFVVNAAAPENIVKLLDRLTALPYHTPLLTCHVPDEMEAAEDLGVAGYLIKPVTRDALLTTLENLGNDIHSVLLVDDETEILRLFSRILASSPREYRVFRATNGQRALDLMQQRRPDVVVLDLVMPLLDGFQLLREKHLNPAIRDIPVIVTSSKDPLGEPIVSNLLTATRSGGLSARDLITCIQALSEILS